MFKNVLRIQVEKYFPRNVRGRPSLLTFDDAYDDILKVVRTGMQWRHLTPKHVSFITVFKTMHKWVAADLFRAAYQTLLRLYSRKRRPRYYCVDSSFVKNIYGSDCVGRNPTDRGQPEESCLLWRRYVWTQYAWTQLDSEKGDTASTVPSRPYFPSRRTPHVDAVSVWRG